MSFHVGQRVSISLPRGASWNKKTAAGNLEAKDVNGKEGTVTQHLAHSGQTEYKVAIKDLGEFRFWERDLRKAEEKSSEPEQAAQFEDAEPAPEQSEPEQESEESSEGEAEPTVN